MVEGFERRPVGRCQERCAVIASGRMPSLQGGSLPALLLACLMVLLMASHLSANTGGTAYIKAKKVIAAPEGFAGLCDRYIWACARGGATAQSAGDELQLAGLVNRTVNRSTREISDRRQYGSEEIWALPTIRGGDCEDFALLKKMELIRRGFAPDRLLIATVLDRKKESHAVLVLRTDRGDLVLDNARNQILPWWKTGYSFLRMQNPAAPDEWSAIMAGGVFQ